MNCLSSSPSYSPRQCLRRDWSGIEERPTTTQHAIEPTFDASMGVKFLAFFRPGRDVWRKAVPRGRGSAFTGAPPNSLSPPRTPLGPVLLASVVVRDYFRLSVARRRIGAMVLKRSPALRRRPRHPEEFIAARNVTDAEVRAGLTAG